ncbi:PREDICTED: uncharacterized protein LOC105974493 isoform X2 [Erythranthe guttata]|uniref:uncharacterized protein LOC105974493 isoform X2 n=1 Tax=Erythranthe guttata TaxID=4155 RepID=UPI00064E03C5|nr:PREDICTED: uncharacterized protein LOC105974493 isoform X2 [Erythranthe guttata]|eukprot:XP_012855059.1 PREDICTED: uncharacterized protein LOC105974493 isoform X2 [Erythranthe guttata]
MDDEIDVDETSDNDEADDNVEPSRMDLFAKCYTKNGETSNPKIADSLVGAKVCLKSISEPSKTVAIGNIQSLDSSKKVGEVRLGPRWCEVHINVGVDPDELLIRRISNFKTIGEAIGLTVAWPQSLVTLDS